MILEISLIKDKIHGKAKIDYEDLHYFVFTETTSNHAYSPELGPINILFKDGSTKDIADASDLLNIRVLEATVVKYFYATPRKYFERSILPGENHQHQGLRIRKPAA